MKYEVRLSVLIKAFLKTNINHHYYLDRHLYQLFEIQNDELYYLDPLVFNKNEDIDQVIQHSVACPDEKELNETGILKDFIRQIEDIELRNILLYSLKSGAVVEQMQDYLINTQLFKPYEKFRFQKYHALAIDWCESNQLDYIIDC